MTTRKRNTYPYEKYHKYVDGVLYKLCANPECETGWMPCTEEYFYKNKKNLLDGLHPTCKKCSIKKARIWRNNNPEKVKIAQYKYDHSERKSKALRENSKRQRESGYYLEWQHKNKDKIAVYNVKRRSKIHDITNAEWDACKKYFNHQCAYCGMTEEEHLEKFKEQLHKEHVNPKGSNDISNCIPSCKICNSEKHLYELEEWYNENNPKFKKEDLEKILNWIYCDYNYYIEN